ncbi:arogenate dehydrogenase 2, chloroplastic-like isoform X2 [Lycium barbarum]|uniref:arogenate dehydrogenase 2, chloroplastic-like isoform X2 n=1 Tax=Lycium barbarum TaxID=112863 RepID=UPI00293E6960|nr:arogenate dehydrogenase 2, chloroplastic-like isoform X2 [Lycium barbarum]
MFIFFSGTYVSSIVFFFPTNNFTNRHNWVWSLCAVFGQNSDETRPFYQCNFKIRLFRFVHKFGHPILQILPEECDLLCTHPMFGPESGKDGWTDLTFMYDMVRIRDQHLCSSFLQIFSTEGCKMLEMTCEEHDRLAARSQFLTHTIGRILVEMEVESTPIDTKGFQKLVQVKESSAKDSFDLFSGLFIHNRFARQQMKNLEVAIEKLQERSKELQDPIISKL